MNDTDVDDILGRAAGHPGGEVDPALLERIASSVRASLHPVRPLAPLWMLVGGLFLIGTAIALAGAAAMGFYGIRKLGATEIAVIFPVLAMVAWAAAVSSVQQMTPGGARRIPPAWLPVAGSLVLMAAFAALFHDFRMNGFLRQGVSCLMVGGLTAIPAGIAGWLLLLRRGYAVNPTAAGLAAGTMASLAGIAMLELHCPNFRAWHILVWHTAVVPLGGLAGAVVGWTRSRG